MFTVCRGSGASSSGSGKAGRNLLYFIQYKIKKYLDKLKKILSLCNRHLWNEEINMQHFTHVSIIFQNRKWMSMNCRPGTQRGYNFLLNLTLCVCRLQLRGSVPLPCLWLRAPFAHLAIIGLLKSVASASYASRKKASPAPHEYDSLRSVS